MKNLADIDISNGGLKGLGTMGAVTDNGITQFSSFMSATIGLMTIIAIVWFIFVFIIGAIGIISAGGDKGALESSKKKISTGIIGLVIVIIAIFIIKLIGFLLGIPNILNIITLFGQIQI